MPDGGYLLTRHADCEYAYKNPALFSSDKKAEFGPKYGDSPLFEHHTTSLVFNDPPRHTRVRRLIASALLPKAIAHMQPGLEALVEASTLSPEPRNFKEGGYLSELPIDPWGRPYLYLSPGEHGEVDIYSLGADGLSGGEGQAADIGNWKSED